MPAIDGIASGIDTTAIIRATTDVARAQAGPIRSRVANFERRREGIAELSSRLQSLADTMSGLTDPDTLVPLVASLSSESQFSVQTGQADVAGQFAVQVRALAHRSSHVSGGVADPDAVDPLVAGTFSVTVGGETTDIAMDADTRSLHGLAAALNQVKGVQAYVVDTGDGAEPFKLVVTAAESGVDGGLTLANNTTQTAFNVTQKVAASDAHVTVNGLDVYSADNQVTDAIPGVRLDLKTVGTEPVTLGLERNEAGLAERLGEFVSAYNEVTSYLRAQSAFDSDVGIRGRLVGETGATRVVGELGSMVSSEYATGGAFEALSQLGLKTEKNGDLALDEATFEAAFASNYDDIVGLLTSEDGPFSVMTRRIEDVYVDEDSGTLQNRDETLEGLITDANDQIDRIDARVSQSEVRLRQRFTAMELAISSYNSTSAYLAALLPNTGLLGSSQ